MLDGSVSKIGRGFVFTELRRGQGEHSMHEEVVLQAISYCYTLIG